MRLLLDTSAVIGWLERLGSRVPALIRGADDVFVHPVTLGELATGVERASSDAQRSMLAATLDFASTRLGAVDADAALPSRAFGVVQAACSRRLSHNDMWIVASAISLPYITIATEDQRLASAVRSSELREAVARAGLQQVGCELVSSSPV